MASDTLKIFTDSLSASSFFHAFVELSRDASMSRHAVVHLHISLCTFLMLSPITLIFRDNFPGTTSLFQECNMQGFQLLCLEGLLIFFALPPLKDHLL